MKKLFFALALLAQTPLMAQDYEEVSLAEAMQNIKPADFKRAITTAERVMTLPMEQVKTSFKNLGCKMLPFEVSEVLYGYPEMLEDPHCVAGFRHPNGYVFWVEAFSSIPDVVINRISVRNEQDAVKLCALLAECGYTKSPTEPREWTKGRMGEPNYRTAYVSWEARDYNSEFGRQLITVRLVLYAGTNYTF